MEIIRMNSGKKYICPKCGQEIPYIRYTEGNSLCYGITVKCNKCKNIVEVRIKSEKVGIKI